MNLAGLDPDVAWDMALVPWHWLCRLPKGGDVYWNPELKEVRLDKYLFTEVYLNTFADGTYALVNYIGGWGATEVLGTIISVELAADRPSFWVVEKDGEIDIFPGKIEHKPVRLSS